MSYAFKCDICKKLYEPLEIGANGPSTNKIRLGVMDDSSWVTSKHRTFDACPNCYCAIVETMNELSDSKKE